MTLILIGLGTGGCSFSRNDQSAYAKADDSDLTGSIGRSAKDAPPTETDLAFARNAASDVLSKGDKDSSQHWENPETGARGSRNPMPPRTAANAVISWRAMSTGRPKAGSRAPAAKAPVAVGRFIR